MPIILRCAPCIGSRKVLPGVERRRDPVLRLDLLQHALAEGRLAQHELDQLRAQDEGAEPEAATRGRRDARRIAGQAVDDRSAGLAVAGEAQHAMAPALADPGAAVRRAAGAEGMAETRGDLAPAPSPRSNSSRRPLRPSSIRSCFQRRPAASASRRWRAAGRGASALSALTAFSGWPATAVEARPVVRAADEAHLLAVEREREAAAGQAGEGGDRALEAQRLDAGRRSAGIERSTRRPSATKSERAVAGEVLAAPRARPRPRRPRSACSTSARRRTPAR